MGVKVETSATGIGGLNDTDSAKNPGAIARIGKLARATMAASGGRRKGNMGGGANSWGQVAVREGERKERRLDANGWVPRGSKRGGKGGG